MKVCNYSADWWQPDKELGWMYKYDGVHIHNPEGEFLTRNNKPLANKALKAHLESVLPIGVQAEICCKDFYRKDCFSLSQTFAMTHELPVLDCIEMGMVIYLFNYYGDDAPTFLNKSFIARHRRLKNDTLLARNSWINLADYFIDKNKNMMSIAETEWAKGGEGIIVFPLDAPYKHVRCSKTKPYCTRIKKRDTDEAIIIDVLPEYYGQGKTIPDQLKGTQKELAGKLVCKSENFEEEFKVAGMKREEKILFWKQKDDIIGRQITYSYMDKGTKDRPRQPSFIGFREDI